MSHLSRKYQDSDTSYDKIMHSTPKHGRDSYDSRMTSYVPGELSRAAENNFSNITEQVSRKENVTVRSGVTRSVTQNAAKSSVESTRGLGFTSEEGRKELRSDEVMRAIGDARSADLNSRRTSEGALLGGENALSGDSSKSVLMETSRSRYSSGVTGDDKYRGTNSDEHSFASKQNEMGFQYEDIASFRERQKVEGDRLEMHRGSLSGNIVGTVKKEALSSREYTTPDSGYSSGMATDSDVHRHSSSVREYKSYGDRGVSHDDRLSRDRILADAKSSVGGGSHLHSGVTHDYKLSSDRGVSHDDRLSRDRILADAKSSVGGGSHLHSSVTHDYKLSSDRGVSHDDRLSRDRILADAKSSVGGGSHLHSSVTHDYKLSSDRGVSYDDRAARDRILEDTRDRAKDGDVHNYSSSRHDYKSSSDLGVSHGDRNKLSGDLRSNSKDVYSSRIDTKVSSASDHGMPHDERFSKTDALVAKYLDSSRYKGITNHGSDIDSEHRHLSSLTEIKEEGKYDHGGRKVEKERMEEKNHSVSDKPMSYLPKDSSYKDLLKKKKRESFSEKTEEEPNLTGKSHDNSSSSKFTYGDITSKIDRSSDYKDYGNVPGSTSKIGVGNIPSSTSKIGGGNVPSSTSKVGDGNVPSSTSKIGVGNVPGSTSKVGGGNVPGSTSKVGGGNVPGSTSKVGGEDGLPRRLSYDWQDDRQARQDANDRLLNSTRRYSSDSILDKTSHDKNLDDVIGAMSNKDLDSSTSHMESNVRETKIDGKPEYNRQSYEDDKSGKTEVYHHRLSNKSSSELDTDRGKVTSGGEPQRPDNDRPRHNLTPEERIRKYKYKDTSRYETPYTSLDHSHNYKPTSFGESVDGDRIYAVPTKPSGLSEKGKPRSSHPDINDKRNNEIPDRSRPDYPPAYKPSSTSKPLDDPGDGIYDKLRRQSGPLEKPKQETSNSGLYTSKYDNRRGSIEGLDEPVYERLDLSSDHGPLPGPKGRDSPIPMSDHYSQPLDKYNKPVALHGKTREPANPDETTAGREIVSRYPDRRLSDRGDLSGLTTEQQSNVTETTRTSYMQRSFMSRNGEVIKDEVKRHDEIRHGGQNAIEGTEAKPSNPLMHTRIQRYPAAKTEGLGRDDTVTDTKIIEDVRRLRDYTETHEDTRKTKDVTPDSHKLDEIMKLTGLENTGDVTNYQEQTRRDDVTRIQDDSNFRTKVHRTDVNTSVNIVKEIPAVKQDKPAKSGKSAFAGLRSKIEALTKSVDELMDYKRRTLLRSYVKEHAERRPSTDLEQLPKIERYEVKSKRYEPKEIHLDEVDYVHKKLELEETPRKPEQTNVELNIQTLWLSEEEQMGKDIGLHIPRQVNLAPENRTVEWWDAPTAEDADRFLCIGDWQWWNANTTEGVDHILGIQAINKETGATGAIIAKYHGEEKPIEWAWLEASNQPSAAEKRRTLTRAFMIDKDNKDSEHWWSATTTEDADQHLSIGNWQWWNANTTEGVDQVLGVRGSDKETGTILATYDEGSKPTAWTWVQTSQKVPEIRVEKNHTITRSSRDIFVDETNNGNVELLIRVKDEESQDPYRYVAIRPGPVDKAIIVRQAVESEMPYTKNLLVEGKGGEGMQVKNGVVQMRIKDMTPEAREAWVSIIGIGKRQMKLKENETVEIPVQVIDKPRPTKVKEDIYAVPNKKKKKQSLVLNRRKSGEVDEKNKLAKKPKGTDLDKKKKEKKLKETEAERKKRELKMKKSEAEKKKKDEKVKIEKNTYK